MEPFSEPQILAVSDKPVMRCCPVCRSTVGVPTANGKQTWYWMVIDTGRVGPFCCATCLDMWEYWPRNRQLASIFGGYREGVNLIYGRQVDQPDSFTHVPMYSDESVGGPAGEINTEESLHWRDLAWSRS